MGTTRTTPAILGNLRDTLEVVAHALSDVRNVPARRRSAVRNLAVFGRAVTNVLQTLRSTEPDFDEWYAPVVARLRADPVAAFFYKLRTQILKEGEVAAMSSYARIKSFDTGEMHKFGPPPPGARRFFIGDHSGGTGWDVEVAPGVVERFYIALPPEIGTTGLVFIDAAGGKLPNADVVARCEQYVATLRTVVAEAEAKFRR